MASSAGTPLPHSRLERLNFAAVLHGFDRALERSAKGSIGWGLFCMGIGGLVFARGGFGWINLIFGVLLVAEGLYEMKVREPQVIMVAAATLGILAVWNLGGLAAAYYLHVRFGGHVWAGVVQAFGAWTTYHSYAVYAALLKQSDPGSKQELEAMLQQTKAADPDLSPDVAQFNVKNLTDPLQIWKVKLFDGLLLFVQSQEVLSVVKFATYCFVAEKHEVRLDILGEKMFGEDRKAIIHIGSEKIKNVVISPGMVQKLQTLLS
jgi:hypothetical protein